MNTTTKKQHTPTWTFSVHRAEGIGRFLVLAEPPSGWRDTADENAFLADLRNFPSLAAENERLREALEAINYCTSGVDDQYATATERACRDKARAALR